MITFDRADWGATHQAGNAVGPVSLVVFHHFWRPHVECGVGLEAERRAMRSVERFHTETNGWGAIAYNFVVFQSGHVWEGRGWGRSGAHTKGENSRSVGVAFAIDGDHHRLSAAAAEASRELLAAGLEAGHLERGFRVAGHRDFSEKSCPGDLVFPILETLRPGSQPAPTPLLGIGDEGPLVSEVQRRIGVEPTGRYDPDTAAAVASWQRDHGLAADGIVGPATWEALRRES